MLMHALLLYLRDISDEFHQWGLIHEPFGFKSSDLTDEIVNLQYT